MGRALALVSLIVAVMGVLLLATSLAAGEEPVLAAPLAQAVNESEPNDSCGSADAMDVAVPVQGNIAPITDVDWFSVTTQAGLPYYASVSTGAPTLKVRLCLYAPGCSYVSCSSASNDYVERIWTASANLYYLKLEEFDTTTDTTKTASYLLEVVEQYISPTPTASNTPTSTPTPTPTNTPTNTPKPTATRTPLPSPNPGADALEPNWDFDTATILGTGKTYEANFIPWVGTDDDNDYYKIWAKPGLHFICEIVELDPGMDPNIIWYNKDRVAIAGNDDKELGDYRSYFDYFSTWEGWLYVLVGHGGRMSPVDVQDSRYTIRCDKEVPGLPDTPTPGPTRTPAPTTAPDTPTNTPAPPPDVTVRPQSTPAAPSPDTPVSRFIPIRIVIYYDGNGDGQFGAGEGIAGVSGRADEATTGQLLAQGFSSAQGDLEFTVSAQGPVLVSVPFFGFSQLVGGEEATIYLRVPPSSY